MLFVPSDDDDNHPMLVIGTTNTVSCSARAQRGTPDFSPEHVRECNGFLLDMVRFGLSLPPLALKIGPRIFVEIHRMLRPDGSGGWARSRSNENSRSRTWSRERLALGTNGYFSPFCSHQKRSDSASRDPKNVSHSLRSPLPSLHVLVCWQASADL